jgi:aryl-alcohol dehydrogenase-like predicted oxidoreductase
VPRTHEVGRLALGTGNLQTVPLDDALAVLDAWVAAGGRLIDTAQNYGAGASESVIGTWLGRRGARDDVVLLTKGGHPNDGDDWWSRVTPENLASDLTGSLERLGVETVDIYLAHRDRPDVPVGEILDALATQVAAGRAGAFGVTNWTIERLDAGNAYAASRGWPPIGWSSPSLSLAHLVAEPWPGCLGANDDASRAWYATHRTTRMEAWSPTANGWFVAGADQREPRFDAYRTAENAARRDRAAAFGAERGLSATQVALAWVVSQPFAPVAVIGTRSIAHLGEAIEGAAVTLTQAELDWLERGDDAGGRGGA